MFQLRDFFHLPELATCLEQMIRKPHGLMLVTGTAARPSGLAGTADVSLPSGRTAIMHMVFNELLAAHPQMRAVMIGQDRAAMRPPRAFKARIRQLEVGGKNTYATLIGATSAAQTGLIMVDQITPDNAGAVNEAAQRGLRILSQFDTPLCGADVAWQLSQEGIDTGQLEALSWIISVMRLPALCPRCSRPARPDPERLFALARHYPYLAGVIQSHAEHTYMTAEGCQHCKGNGRFGEVTAFGIYHAPPRTALEATNCRAMPLKEYLLRLAIAGRLPLEEVTHFEALQRRRLYNLVNLYADTVTHQTDNLKRRLLELETANRVLQQRTEQLISLESIGQTLIATDDLNELAYQVCQRLDALCGADRVVLYYQHHPTTETLHPDAFQGDELEILAVSGWSQEHAGLLVRPGIAVQIADDPASQPYRDFPPGIEPGLRGVVTDDRERLQAGLCLPLTAHGVWTGLMVVQSTRKKLFLPGERALLQAFANQVALAIQRAGLMQERIRHERLERELELARQLQQSMLPQLFPEMPGIGFAARCQPARWIGGDFYDVFSLENGQVALVIGDASDKGLPAALYMGLTRSLIRAEARRSDSTETILRRVNRLLLDLGELRGFISLCLAIVDPDKRLMRYSRAGHERPLLVRGGGLEQLGEQGMILGILPDAELTLGEYRLDLQAGDRLVFYSDGLPDTLNEAGEFYGEKRFLETVQKHAYSQAADYCAAIVEELRSFQGRAEQYDDMTLVVMEVG